MTYTLHLPDDLTQRLEIEAQKQNTTIEELILRSLQKHYEKQHDRVVDTPHSTQ
jgi:predicted transcriptional regulator